MKQTSNKTGFGRLLLLLEVSLVLAIFFVIARYYSASLSAVGGLASSAAAATDATASSSRPTVYMIRHGEKPASGNGLNAEGLERAQCLRTVFGADGNYNIGYIMAQEPKPDGRRKRPLDTVKPLAKDLGLTVDTSCDRDDVDCVVKKITSYKGPGDILLCWEHGRLTKIAEALGVEEAPWYPSDVFHHIWTLPHDYTAVASIKSERCPNLDR